MQIQPINLPPLSLWQHTVVSHTAKRKVIAAGKRAGKTELGAILCHKVAAQGGTAWWVARTYKVGQPGWLKIRDLAQEIRRKTGIQIRILESEPYTIIYPNGGMIQVRAVGVDPNDLRGVPLDLIVFDEAAFIPNIKQAWLAVQTGLLDRSGTAYFISTPFGFNQFATYYQYGLKGGPEKRRGWQSFQFTTFDNPFIRAADVEAMMEEMDELDIKQEIYAEFLEGTGLVFRGVRSHDLVPVGRLPERGHAYTMGIDWGRVKDYTVIVVIDAATSEVVYTEAFNKISWATQIDRLQAVNTVWQPSVIWAEENTVGSVNIERMEDAGLPVKGFHTNYQSKQLLIDSLVLAIEKGELSLLDDEEMLKQLENYQQFPLPAGGYRFSAPIGEHDDYVIALALAWHGIRRGNQKAAMRKAPEKLSKLWGSFGR